MLKWCGGSDGRTCCHVPPHGLSQALCCAPTGGDGEIPQVSDVVPSCWSWLYLRWRMTGSREILRFRLFFSFVVQKKSQRRIAEGEGEFQAVTESSYGAREEPRRGSTSESVSSSSGGGSVGSRQPRRRSSQSIFGGSEASMPHSTCVRTFRFVFEVCGTLPRTRLTTEKIVEEAQQVLANCESQFAGGLQDLERLHAEARTRPVPPPSHDEPASETAELRELCNKKIVWCVETRPVDVCVRRHDFCVVVMRLISRPRRFDVFYWWRCGETREPIAARPMSCTRLPHMRCCAFRT